MSETYYLTVFHVTLHSGINTSRLPWQRRAEQAAANMSCSKTFFLVTLCTQTMLSVLVFMCRDPGDATSKVSCCVQTSYCFKYGDFDAIVKVPVALPLKMSWTRKWKYGKSLKCLFHRNYAFTLSFDSYTFTKKASVAFWREFHFKAAERWTLNKQQSEITKS